MVTYGNAMVVHGHPWSPMVIFGNAVVIHGHTTSDRGLPWSPTDIDGNATDDHGPLGRMAMALPWYYRK